MSARHDQELVQLRRTALFWSPRTVRHRRRMAAFRYPCRAGREPMTQSAKARIQYLVGGLLIGGFWYVNRGESR